MSITLPPLRSPSIAVGERVPAVVRGETPRSRHITSEQRLQGASLGAPIAPSQLSSRILPRPRRREGFALQAHPVVSGELRPPHAGIIWSTSAPCTCGKCAIESRWLPRGGIAGALCRQVSWFNAITLGLSFVLEILT